jgi:hypothetical protein
LPSDAWGSPRAWLRPLPYGQGKLGDTVDWRAWTCDISL